jgi:hypothetical protein
MKLIFMKRMSLLFCGSMIAFLSWSQVDQTRYPEPEFSNEVYMYRKDSVTKLLRLEKGSSKMDTKIKLGGMGGAENSYSIDGERSTVRLTSGNNLSFVFSTGVEQGKKNSPQMDSVMRANGVDPSMMSMMQDGMMDPSKMITLYQADLDKNNRKVYLMKTGGAIPFASKKNKTSDKFSISVRKIRNGYWELMIDKTLPKGEYAFTVMGMGAANMDGSVTIFAFGID